MKIAEVNLTNQEVNVTSPGEATLDKFIGGSGLGALKLYNQTTAETDPLSGENPLIFLTGPLTGTPAISSDRFEVITKSPLTGLYAEANSGGRWGGMLRRSGFDGVMIQGVADKPVYLWIHDKEVEIRSAKELWGLDTFECPKEIKNRTKSEAQVACIGPAGENLVKFASIMTGGTSARAAGRAGVGTIMGHKKLKALAVYGNEELPVMEEDKLRDFIAKETPPVIENVEDLHKYGTSNAVENLESCGDLPIRNWHQGKWEEGASKLSGQAMADTIQTGYYHCGGCPIGCGREVKVANGPYQQEVTQAGPEYETVGMLGSNLLLDDLPALAKATEWCNRYGMDTVSTGSLIGFAMEAYEQELITKADTNGISLEWGDPDAVISMVHQIAKRGKLGDILAEGIASSVERLGAEAKEFAVHVKGLDFPAHDPRAKVSSALGYITSPRGACHLQAFTHDFEEGTFEPGPTVPDLGYPETLDRFTAEGKAEMVADFQNLMSLFDSLTICKLPLFGGYSVEPLLKTFNLTTGKDWSKEKFLKTGERIFTLKRMYNHRIGISRKDDSLPPRILYHRRGGGTNELPPINEMLSDYYKYREWDEFGVPSEEKLEELGLSEIVN